MGPQRPVEIFYGAFQLAWLVVGVFARSVPLAGAVTSVTSRTGTQSPSVFSWGGQGWASCLPVVSVFSPANDSARRGASARAAQPGYITQWPGGPLPEQLDSRYGDPLSRIGRRRLSSKSLIAGGHMATLAFNGREPVDHVGFGWCVAILAWQKWRIWHCPGAAKSNDMPGRRSFAPGAPKCAASELGLSALSGLVHLPLLDDDVLQAHMGRCNRVEGVLLSPENRRPGRWRATGRPP